MRQDMRLSLTSNLHVQELVGRVRSRLQAAAATLLTGNQLSPQPAANGIVSGLPQHQHAAVTAVASALAELQQLDSDSADASSTAGTSFRWSCTGERRAAQPPLTDCMLHLQVYLQDPTGREPVQGVVAVLASCV